jgi:hypothetical protein
MLRRCDHAWGSVPLFENRLYQSDYDLSREARKRMRPITYQGKARLDQSSFILTKWPALSNGSHCGCNNEQSQNLQMLSHSKQRTTSLLRMTCYLAFAPHLFEESMARLLNQGESPLFSCYLWFLSQPKRYFCILSEGWPTTRLSRHRRKNCTPNFV